MCRQYKALVSIFDFKIKVKQKIIRSKGIHRLFHLNVLYEPEPNFVETATISIGFSKNPFHVPLLSSKIELSEH